MNSLSDYINNINLLKSKEEEYDKTKDLIKQSDRIIFLGCGGSMSTCGHMAHDFLKIGKKKTLCPQSASLLTCLFNDYQDYDVYTEWLKIQAEVGDLLIVVSSSGNSPCTAGAARYFKNFVGKVVTLTAMDDFNELRMVGDVNVWFDTKSYGVHEIYSEIFLHAILDDIVNENK